MGGNMDDRHNVELISDLFAIIHETSYQISEIINWFDHHKSVGVMCITVYKQLIEIRETLNN